MHFFHRLKLKRLRGHGRKLLVSVLAISAFLLLHHALASLANPPFRPLRLILTLSAGIALTAFALGLLHQQQRALVQQLQSLTRENRLLQKIFQGISGRLVILDRDFRIRYYQVDRPSSGIAPKSAQARNIQKNIPPLCCYELFYRRQAPCKCCLVQQVFADGEARPWIRREDDKRFIEIRAFPIFDDAGGVYRVAEQISDVTQRVLTEKALQESEKLFRTVVESSKDAMVAINRQGRITLFNSGAEQIFGRTKAELLHAPVEELMPYRYRTSHRPAVKNFFAESGASQIMGKTLELEARRGNGQAFPIELSLSSAEVGGERLVLAVIRDITERKLFEQQLIHQATVDDLTGLPNRSLILDRLQQALAGLRRRRGQLAVLLLDLDKFKDVNDSLGHNGGNSLLREVALRLSAAVRQSDTVGRLYGDEFVILLSDVKERSCVLR